MNETLLTKRCKDRKLVGDEVICKFRGIPCIDIKKEDCILMEEYKIVSEEEIKE